MDIEKDEPPQCISVQEYLNDIGHLMDLGKMPDINADFNRFSQLHSWNKHNSNCDVAYLFLNVGEQESHPISPKVNDPVGLHWVFLFERGLRDINPRLVPIDFIKRFPVYLNRELEGGPTYLFQKLICEKAAKNFWNELVHYALHMTFSPDVLFEQDRVYYDTIGDCRLVGSYDRGCTWFSKRDKDGKEHVIVEKDANTPLYPPIKKMELVVPTDTGMIKLLTIGGSDNNITYGEFIIAVTNHYESLESWSLYGYSGIRYRGKKFYM